MPASKFAAWLGTGNYSKSGVTGVTSVTETPKPSLSADLRASEPVTPGPTESVTGVTSGASDVTRKVEVPKRAASVARNRAPFDLPAFLNETYEGVIFSTRPSRRGRLYRRSAS
jgi:hypothetical protein